MQVQKHPICKKDYIRNHVTCSCENSKYLASVIRDSVIMLDEVIDAKAKTKKQKQFQQILMKRV